jgi:hypothetical protein
VSGLARPFPFAAFPSFFVVTLFWIESVAEKTAAAILFKSWRTIGASFCVFFCVSFCVFFCF